MKRRIDAAGAGEKDYSRVAEVMDEGAKVRLERLGSYGMFCVSDQCRVLWKDVGSSVGVSKNAGVLPL